MSTIATNGKVPGTMFRTMPAPNATAAPCSTERCARDGFCDGSFGFCGRRLLR